MSEVDIPDLHTRTCSTADILPLPCDCGDERNQLLAAALKAAREEMFLECWERSGTVNHYDSMKRLGMQIGLLDHNGRRLLDAQAEDWKKA